MRRHFAVLANEPSVVASEYAKLSERVCKHFSQTTIQTLAKQYITREQLSVGQFDSSFVLPSLDLGAFLRFQILAAYGVEKSCFVFADGLLELFVSRKTLRICVE
jgi:hypothetical protein